MLRRDLDRLVQVARLDDVEAADRLLRLGERPVDDEHLAAAHADGRGILVGSQALAVLGDAARLKLVDPLADVVVGGHVRQGVVPLGVEQCVFHGGVLPLGHATQVRRTGKPDFDIRAVIGGIRCGSRSVREHEHDAEADHDDGDDRVEHAPRARAREHAAEEPRAVGEAEEPDEARDARTGREGPAAVAVGVRDRAEQEHRVEVHVRVQPSEGEAGQHGCGEAGAPPGERRRRDGCHGVRGCRGSHLFDNCFRQHWICS